MARNARIVVPGVPHHVTQRGNRRLQTFFKAEDYTRYTELMAEASRQADVEVLAWCLMPNHVHLVLVPATTDGLARALSTTHKHYTWAINRRNGWQGHLWQGRFYSSALDDVHLQAVVRYVELNPVRARLSATPEQWRWSSVHGRISGDGDKLVRRGRPQALRDVGDWQGFLAVGLSDEATKRLRRHQYTGAVLGDAAFVATCEARIGQRARIQPRGRPRSDDRHKNGVLGADQLPLFQDDQPGDPGSTAAQMAAHSALDRVVIARPPTL